MCLVAEKVMDFCEKNNMAVSAFEKMCGLTNGTVYHWKEDNYDPSVKSLIKIAEATGTKLEDWIR